MAEHFGIGQKMDIPGEDIWKKPIWLIEKYACNDVDLTYEIDNKMLPQIDERALERECKLINILVQMKKNGIKVNEERLNSLNKEWRTSLYNITRSLPISQIWNKTALTNLFHQLNIPYYKTSTGQPSFTKQFLESIDHPVIQQLLEARQLDRLINTFLKGIHSHLVNGKIHPDYFNGRSEFGGTLLGRFSSAHPNIQQVPQRSRLGLQVKELFIPTEKENIFGRWDYSQQEPRLSIHYVNLLNLPAINEWSDRYNNDPASDCYLPVTQQMKIDRQSAKTIWLAVSYGMGPRHMSEVMGIPIEKATEYLQDFYKAVPWIKPMIRHCINKVEKRGFIITIGKRRLYFDTGFEYKGMNGLIQGSAADQTKQAMIDIHERTGKIPLIQVHDELDYELTETEFLEGMSNDISKSMKEAFILSIPSKVDFTMGHNWKDCCEK
jgi:DNA polymerase-1